MFQPKLQTFPFSGRESGGHVETIPTNGSLFMQVGTTAGYFSAGSHFSQQMTSGTISVLHVTASGPLGPL